MIAGHWIVAQSRFTDQGSQFADAVGGAPLSGSSDTLHGSGLAPNAYLTLPIAAAWHAGIGLNAPYGMGGEYAEDWIGRYHALNSQLRSLNLNPALAYRVNEAWSVGVGVNLQYVEVELSSAIDFGTIGADSELPGMTPGSHDGRATVEGSSVDWGWNVGVIYQPVATTRIGLAYRSTVSHRVDGKATFEYPDDPAATPLQQALTAQGLFIDSDAHATVKLPANLSIALAQQLTPPLTLLASATWTGWSDFPALRISYDSNQPDSVTTEGWQDSWRYALGLRYRLNDRWLLRSGIALDQTPIPNATYRTARIPGNDRRWLSVGAGYALSPTMQIDVGYAHLFLDDAPIDNQLESSSPELNATLSGYYSNKIDILSLQLGWQF